MKTKDLILITALIWATSANAQLSVYDSRGNFRGNIGGNPYDADSIANPYGDHGNPMNADSVANPVNKHRYQIYDKPTADYVYKNSRVKPINADFLNK